jgi:Sulfotransferase family
MSLFTGQNKIILVSLHIPKTAGTSFRNILKNIYGENQVARFDISRKGVVRLNESIYKKSKLPNVKVIHGHFTFQDLSDSFTLPESYKFITWMRDPVKRVISNYYYLESRLQELHDKDKSLNILSKMQRSLIEYARAEINRNRQAKFLTGCKLEDFDFIGIQEDFENELLRLSTILGWKEIPENLIQNKTMGNTKDVEPSIISEIRDLNEQDAQLYDKALQIKNSFRNN